MTKALIVGAGITGCTIARMLADINFDVTIMEQSNNIGGACSDIYKGCNYPYRQNHGSHIFHTNNENVMKFLSNFMELSPYIHKVKGLINGELVPIPINLTSLETLFSKEYAKILLSQIDYYSNCTFEDLQSLFEETKELANWIYDNVFKYYSFKQWGKQPGTSTLNRVKAFRCSKDARYFLDKYQGIPMRGFTKMMEKMIYCQPNISIRLNKKVEHSMFKEYDIVFYTGTIDEIFDFKLGKLPYRTCDFAYRVLPITKYQEVAVINYTQNYDFTRSHDYSWYLPSAGSIIAYEYPKQHNSEDEPRYYPIKEEENLKLYEEYKQLLAKEYPNVIPAGRLGTYQYIDMDKAVENAMMLVSQYLSIR